MDACQLEWLCDDSAHRVGLESCCWSDERCSAITGACWASGDGFVVIPELVRLSVVPRAFAGAAVLSRRRRSAPHVISRSWLASALRSEASPEHPVCGLSLGEPISSTAPVAAS